MGEPLDICALADLADGAAKGFEIPGGLYDGFVVRRGTAVHAYLNTCPHSGARLDWKPDAFLTRSRELIMCSVHGAIFEVENGLCVGGPCVGRSLRPLAAEVRDGRILITSDLT
ncbi:MAG: Rieske 2Fe-2S domain-containing protein [Xanthomonadaceae bacterium]|nr:Rieske 2Fe-2S domain-containing protein [Xanthomonadaceae bacterium]